MYLAGETEARGFHLENMILCDLLAWRDSMAQRPTVMHWRTPGGDEVDFVLEFANGELIAVECKSGSRPGHNDARSLRVFIEEYGQKVRGALLLHGGSETYGLGDRILATPWWRIV